MFPTLSSEIPIRNDYVSMINSVTPSDVSYFREENLDRLYERHVSSGIGYSHIVLVCSSCLSLLHLPMIMNLLALSDVTAKPERLEINNYFL